MTVTDNQELIINIDGKTKCLTKKQIENAFQEPKTSCANYERDNFDVCSPTAKWVTTDLFKNSKSLDSFESKVLEETFKKQIKTEKKLLKIYLAIPYSGMEESSYKQATEATMLVINEYGYNVFSPITHSHPIAKLGVKGTWDYWQNIDYQFIDWADEVWVLIPEEGIHKCFLSTGVVAELKYAEKHEKPIKFVSKRDNKITEDYGSR